MSYPGKLRSGSKFLTTKRIQYLLLHELHNGACVHEELVMVRPLGNGGGMSVNDIHNLYAGELIQDGCDVRGVAGQTFLDGLFN